MVSKKFSNYSVKNFVILMFVSMCVNSLDLIIVVSIILSRDDW